MTPLPLLPVIRPEYSSLVLTLDFSNQTHSGYANYHAHLLTFVDILKFYSEVEKKGQK